MAFNAVLGRATTIPSFSFHHQGDGAFTLNSLQAIGVDISYVDSVNYEGQTLIPPTLGEFVRTFQEDLSSVADVNIPIKNSSTLGQNAIFVTINSNGTYLDAAGRHTNEGYSLTVNETGITICGASSLGAWWGTRTVLQMAAVNAGNLPYGDGVDAPGWATRGVMLDCGRHFYPPEFLVEMCAYISFFKQNEFHLHLSDNLFVNKDLYTREQIWDLYSSFRLWSEAPAVAGLAQLRNESYSHTEFQDIQKQCARRGVTIVPELEAPAHALAISKWKPEAALDEDPTMLNISHPSTLPLLRDIWSTFLPWFNSKTVHIGADEYHADMIGDYTFLVNELSAFIRDVSGRQTRIWGTFTPAKGANVSTDITIQHWASYEDSPYFDFIQNGYDVVNSDFAFYTNVKWNAYFPPTLNKTLIFSGNPLGGSFAPHVFDLKNATNNPTRYNPRVVGHIAAQWNDFGPATSTYLESYHGWRNGLPALADKQWGGSLREDEYDAVLETLVAAVPGQNLDRRVKSISNTILSYSFSQATNCSTQLTQDLSGNGYDGVSRGCLIGNSTLYLDGDCFVETPLESKGRNYTLSFSVKPSSSKAGILFSGPDSVLMSGYGSTTNLTFIAAGIAFPLNYSLPLDTWTDVKISNLGNSTFCTVSHKFGLNSKTMEFLARIDANGVPSAKGVMVTWQPVAFEAPSREIGRGFIGMMTNITLDGGY